MTRAQKVEREGAIAQMRKWLRPGDTVYTILRHVSRSGMQREVGVVLMLPPDERGGRTPIDLHPNYSVAKILGERQGKRDGVIVSGAGMDMGWHLVYTLSRYLWPDGFGCIGEGCPSNDHSNGDRDSTPHGCMCGGDCGRGIPGTKERPADFAVSTWNEHWHRDGGYALRMRWL